MTISGFTSTWYIDGYSKYACKRSKTIVLDFNLIGKLVPGGDIDEPGFPQEHLNSILLHLLIFMHRI